MLELAASDPPAADAAGQFGRTVSSCGVDGACGVDESCDADAGREYCCMTGTALSDGLRTPTPSYMAPEPGSLPTDPGCSTSDALPGGRGAPGAGCSAGAD